MAKTKPDTKNTSVGKPKVGGALFCAPVGTALPTDTAAPLNEAFVCLGYCGDKGLVNANEKKAEEFKAWGGATVCTSVTSHTDTFAFKMLEVLNPDVLKVVHGDKNVTGTLTTGITVMVNAMPQGEKAWVIEMLMRDNAVKRIVIPQAAVVEVGEVTYADNDLAAYDCKIQATEDADGQTHYEYIKKGA